MQLLSFKKRMENSCVSFSVVGVCNTFQFTWYGIVSKFKFQNINLNVTIVNVSHLNPAFTND